MTLNPPALKVSSYCSTGACVGVGLIAESIVMMDTKSIDNPVEVGAAGITFTGTEWDGFVKRVADDETVADETIDISLDEQGHVLVSKQGEPRLHFFPDEWDAFRRGAIDGEFDVSELRIVR